MNIQSKVVVEILDDGTFKVDASKAIGSEAELLELLGSLAKEVGGELEVERHVEGAHHHHHGDGRSHTHGRKT